VRQTNVVWLVLAGAVALAESPPAWSSPRPLQEGLRRTWTALLGVLAFAGFVLWNGAVAVGGRGAFAAGLHTGNLFLFLALYFVLFLPANLYAMRKRPARLADKTLWLGLAAAYAVFILTFRVDHPFNKFEGFLRNEMLSWVATDVTAGTCSSPGPRWGWLLSTSHGCAGPRCT
jgi:hypothetical protein